MKTVSRMVVGVVLLVVQVVLAEGQATTGKVLPGDMKHLPALYRHTLVGTCGCCVETSKIDHVAPLDDGGDTPGNPDHSHRQTGVHPRPLPWIVLLEARLEGYAEYLDPHYGQSVIGRLHWRVSSI